MADIFLEGGSGDSYDTHAPSGRATSACHGVPRCSPVVRGRELISPYRVSRIMGVAYTEDDRNLLQQLVPSDLGDGYCALPGPPQALTLKGLFAQHPTSLCVPSWSDNQSEPFWMDKVNPGVLLVRHDPAEDVPHVRYSEYRYPLGYRSPNITEAVWCVLVLKGVTSSNGLERFWTATRCDGNQLVLDTQGRFDGKYTLQSFGGKKRNDTRFLPVRQITCG